MVDTAGSKSAVRKYMPVRVRPPVPKEKFSVVRKAQKPARNRGLFVL